MTGIQLTSPHTPLIVPNPDDDMSAEVKRGAEILASLTLGALGGYIVYWINRLIAKMGWLGEGVVLQPLPYILAGIASAAIVETACLVHDAALYVLGDHDECEKLAELDDVSGFDRLRQKAWKVIDYADQAQKDIDVIYSRIFNIRTGEQIRTKYKTEKEYYLSDPRFMEVARRAFCEQTAETFKTAIPQELGIYAVEALGYVVVGGHLFAWLHGIMFFNGLVDKIGKVYQAIDLEERKERKKRRDEHENRVAFNTLAALYPDEIAKLDAELDILDDLDDLDEVEDETMVMDSPELEEIQDDEVEEENPFGDKAVFIQCDDDEFDLRDYKNVLNYRHTVFQANYPITGFPIKDIDDIEFDSNDDDSDAIEEIQEKDLPDNFVLVGGKKV